MSVKPWCVINEFALPTVLTAGLIVRSVVVGYILEVKEIKLPPLAITEHPVPNTCI